MSFKPDEITPDRAMEVAEELCHRLLKEQYQYVLAVHEDHRHIHAHIIVNNTNFITGRTFETEHNQGKKSDRAWAELRRISDDICREHHLSVIDHPEEGKGKSHWEWDMSRQGLSWKARLKYAIDQVINDSEDFDDFLRKCAENGIMVEFNPDHKIDLKFMLAEQKERNPRAKFTRGKTLGWFYETEQIRKRIAQYLGGMAYVPRIKVTQRTQKPVNKFVQDAINRGDMKIASIAKNIIAKYGIEPMQTESELMVSFAQKTALAGELNSIQRQIEDLTDKLIVLKEFRKYKEHHDHVQTLSGREKKKYRKDHSFELYEYDRVKKEILELYPDGRIPKVEKVEERIEALIAERKQKNAEYNALAVKVKELSQAKRDLDDYLCKNSIQKQQYQSEEQSRSQQKKKNDFSL